MISDKQQYAKAKLLEFIQLIKDGAFDDELHTEPEVYMETRTFRILLVHS